MKRNNLLFFSLLIGLAVPCALADEKSFVYDAKGKRDPFWSLVNPSGNIMNYETDLEMNDLALEGVVADAKGNNLAIINGKVVKVNDHVGQFTVYKIEKNKVTILKGTETFELRLKKEE